MNRRAVLVVFSGVALTGFAGCSTGSIGDGPTGTAVPVTTSSAERIEFLASQISIPADAAGPNAYYRIRNPAATEATIRLETVYTIQGGDTYRESAVVTVPPGEEVTVSYRLVAFADLTDAEEAKVRQGEVEFVVLVNGEERRDG